jgi:molybdenum cofactor synthesis domain-containing protein
MYKIGIITASDKGAANERIDLSGPLISEIMTHASYDVAAILIVPDEIDLLADAMIDFADEKQLSLILTTGGTGFSPRDVTPEATRRVVERFAPGISEAMRMFSLTKTPKAMLSRGVSGIRGRCLIINLPGSPKAVEECLTYILPALRHGLDILTGAAAECARE